MATLVLKRHQKQELRRQNDGRCKKHPKHSQSPGVCSVCLREKLSQIDKSPKTSIATSSTTSSLSSYYSSSSSSACSSSSSPVPGDDYASSSSLFSGVIHKSLKKSRSMAFVPRFSMRSSNSNIIGANIGSHEKKRSNSGFWSKLIKHNYKRSVQVQERIASFMQYSRTVRERPHQRL